MHTYSLPVHSMPLLHPVSFHTHASKAHLELPPSLDNMMQILKTVALVTALMCQTVLAEWTTGSDAVGGECIEARLPAAPMHPSAQSHHHSGQLPHRCTHASTCLLPHDSPHRRRPATLHMNLHHCSLIHSVRLNGHDSPHAFSRCPTHCLCLCPSARTHTHTQEFVILSRSFSIRHSVFLELRYTVSPPPRLTLDYHFLTSNHFLLI
jgi:hypothetical protein